MTELTAQKVKELIEKATPLELELVWIPKIMRNQTTEEVSAEQTIEFNNIGLNAWDGPCITAYYFKIKDGMHLTDEQATIARKKLIKYAKQYVELAQIHRSQNKQAVTA
jgi:hypothetical protein